MSNDQLLQLIGRARQRDQKAQTQLINYFWVDVFSFVLSKVHNENDADEITVSVFSKVLVKLDLFDPAYPFKTWLLTIARNMVIDFWRRRSRGNEDATETLQDSWNEFEKSPEELLISEEQQKKIIGILESMDVNYRDILRLRFFEEKSIKEIADELNISASNTKVRIMRAKKILAQLLKENDYDVE